MSRGKRLTRESVAHMEERLLARVPKDAGPGDCWRWDGYIGVDGYGQQRVNGVMEKVHRLAGVLWVVKEIPAGMCMLHECNHKWCYQPECLRLGTYAENTQSAIRDGLHGQKPRLTNNQVEWARWVYSLGVSISFLQSALDRSYAKVQRMLHGITYKTAGGPIAPTLPPGVNRRYLGAS